MLDTLGVTVAGANEEATRLAAGLAIEEGGRAQASALGQQRRVTLLQAAFLNGVASHAHDFDHSFVQGGQPTSPIIPAAFAVAEAVGASGAALLEAYFAGFEVVGGLMFAVQDAGGTIWHANGTVGVFGAAAAAAKLLELSEPQTATALAMAASMAGGVQSNFGTMTKPLHVGNAARHGVLAAKLAKAGFTANTQTLEARNGYLNAYYAPGQVQAAPLEALGRPTWVAALERFGVRFKPYPCGGLTHTAIYSAIRLRDQHRVAPASIDRVQVSVPADTAAPLVYRVPRNGLEGKFSMPYLIARALIDGTVTLDTFTDDAVANRDVLALLEKVQMTVDPTLRSGTDGGRPSSVTVRLNDGRMLAHEERFPKGSPQTPMSREERVDKFRSCARASMSASASTRAIEFIEGMESQPNIRALASLLR